MLFLKKSRYEAHLVAFKFFYSCLYSVVLLWHIEIIYISLKIILWVCWPTFSFKLLFTIFRNLLYVQIYFPLLVHLQLQYDKLCHVTSPVPEFLDFFKIIPFSSVRIIAIELNSNILTLSNPSPILLKSFY